MLSSEMILSEMNDIDPQIATGAPFSHTAIATTTLTALPTEIIHQIATHIPTSGVVALKLTTKQLFHQLPSPPQDYMKSASDCEKRAIRRYVGERWETSGGRRKCILCDGMMPVELFFREEPVCKWHEGWFERVLEVRGLPRSYGDGVLERQRRVRVLCGHCKQIRGWDVERCPCEATGSCGSCGSWKVECRIRLVDVAV